MQSRTFFNTVFLYLPFSLNPPSTWGGGPSPNIRAGFTSHALVVTGTQGEEPIKKSIGTW